LTNPFPEFFKAESQSPNPARADQADMGTEQWLEGAKVEAEFEEFATTLANLDDGRFLKSVFGNSAFLTQCILKERHFLQQLLNDGARLTYESLLQALEKDFGQERNLEAVMAGLRNAKRRVALLVALADIIGLWELDQVTEALSRFAALATVIAVRFALRQSVKNGKISIPDDETPERHSGYAIIALGKLGANELNYSSDIDLIVIYDPDRIISELPETLGPEMVRVTRLIIKLLDERTQDGYVFRTDFRIRPDPGSTPLAIPLTSAITYYETMGQNWERLALIRARPIAGDMELGNKFLEQLRPFIWRKHLDFAAIQDIHSVKRQITAFRGGGKIAINGHNIKLGRGGIREIEFYAQTLQLIWGGRTPELRTRKLATTLQALATEGRISLEAAEDLLEAYQFLRKIEHRLQMVDDRQTHELPKTDEGIDAIAVFLGFDDPTNFRTVLRKSLETVERHYASLFEDSESLGAADRSGNLVFTGVEDDPDTLKSLRELGFSDPKSISEIVRNWHRGRYRATRTERARQILTELMPHLLETFGKRSHPDKALIHFDGFLKSLPSGVQLFSLFASHPPVLGIVAEIMGDAPTLAGWLARNPSLLDHILSQDFHDPLSSVNALGNDLREKLALARDFQDQLDFTRRWVNDRKFQIGVQLLLGSVKGRDSGPQLSNLAECTVQEMLRCAADEFSIAHGCFKESGMAVVAFGKLGGRELMYGSDLDLVFVYDPPPDDRTSDGDKPLGPNVFYMRLAQRLITALSAMTGEGGLYEVDTRLRPNGEKGPIAVNLVSFQRYYQDAAWTWEYMALSRARVIAGPEKLRMRLNEIIEDVHSRRWDRDTLVADVAKMRGRMAEQYPGKSIWDIKHRRGGLVDGEFIAQYLQLLHGADHPEILSPTAIKALDRLRKGGLLDTGIAHDLIEGLSFWYNVQSVLRVTADHDLDDAAQNAGPRDALARAGEAKNFDHLQEKMDAVAKTIYAHFHTLIAKPAASTEPTAENLS
jgi:glutamate-ammonia-ligase adenylyltransferase